MSDIPPYPQSNPQQGYPTQYPPYPQEQTPGYPPSEYPSSNQQAAYPPSGYPQQPGYPPTGYPSQPGYPPQPGYPAYPSAGSQFTQEAPPAYPSQGYPTQQGFSEKDAPPPYFGQPAPPQPVQQAQSANVVVVTQQPAVTTATFSGRYGSSDHYLVVTIIVMSVCCLFGSIFTLLCTIPALLSALEAREAEKRGEHLFAAFRDRRTISLNISAIVFGIVVIIIVASNAAFVR